MYYKVSTDAGATWGPEARVNWDDSVVVEYGATDLCAGSSVYDIWQDSRGANRDIYVHEFIYGPPPFDFGQFSGGISKVKVEILNPSDEPTENISWTIKVTGGILGRINVTSSGMIETLGSGDSVEIQTRGLLFGLGRISVLVTAYNQDWADAKSVDGKQLLFYTRFL